MSYTLIWMMLLLFFFRKLHLKASNLRERSTRGSSVWYFFILSLFNYYCWELIIRFNVHISIDDSPIEIDQFQPSIELNAFGISVDVAFCSSLSSPTQWNGIQLIEMCHLHLDCCNSSCFIIYWGWLEHATKNINTLSASPNYSLKHSILIHLLNSLTGYFWLNNFDCLLIVFDVR